MLIRKPSAADIKLAVITVLIFTILYFVQLKNYLLFHVFAEFFSIAIACSVFIIAWNGRKYIRDNYLMIIGLAYLFIGFMDVLHVIGYKGMQIFRGYDYYANQFWIAGRGMESVTILVSMILIGKTFRLNIRRILLIYTGASGFLIYTILFSDIFPPCFVEGSGQTVFKVSSEYVINTVLAVSLFILGRKKDTVPSDTFRLMILSIIFTIISELAFTFYISNYGFSNMLGHYAKLISFYYIYRAIVSKGITEPYNIIFRELSEQKQSLAEADELKTRLFSIIAHDLSGPVAGVDGAVRTLDDDYDDLDEATRKSFISELRKSLDKTASLLENLLAWSKLEIKGSTSRFSTIDPVLLLAGIVDEQEPNYRLKGVRLDFISTETGRIDINPDTFRIVIRNILSNALKFSQEASAVKLFIGQEGDRIIIRILDMGTGMNFDPAMLMNPVNSSRRGTADEKGAGLGLYLIRKYTEENQGGIEIKSSPGSGTEVILSFPESAAG